MQTGLLERAYELERIDALLALARADSGDILLITGPAGIGKSVLLGVARERAHLAGMQVLSGRGRELEGGFRSGSRGSCLSRCSPALPGRSGMPCSPGRRAGP
jgi:hypothetical protein